jgi:hypothetical protein
MTPSPTSTSQGSVPPPITIDALHRDIAFANSYRLELIKLLMALSTALLAFTVTFRPDLKQVVCPQAMWVGWFGLALSMIGGMVHMHGWDRFYMTYRDFDHKYRAVPTPNDGNSRGKQKRKKINIWRQAGMVCQFIGFAIGVTGVAIFAAVNVDGKRQQEPSASTTAAMSAAASADAASTASAAAASVQSQSGAIVLKN